MTPLIEAWWYLTHPRPRDIGWALVLVPAVVVLLVLGLAMGGEG